MEKKSREVLQKMATSLEDFEVIEYDSLSSITGGCGPMDSGGCQLNVNCEGTAKSDAGTL